jgi:hypothetical protein
MAGTAEATHWPMQSKTAQTQRASARTHSTRSIGIRAGHPSCDGTGERRQSDRTHTLAVTVCACRDAATAKAANAVRKEK